MKTKQEILKMTKGELLDYKWSPDLKRHVKNSGCINCRDCDDCDDCRDCGHCVGCRDCYACRNINKKSQYLICNVQVTKEEYEKKMKELGFI